MKPKSPFLTKSRFVVGYECPTKLYFLDNPQFASNKEDDLFLQSLADGGFQVGALAKLYYPGGIEVEDKSHEQAVLKTQELMKKDSVIIYEAALKFSSFFVRVDILKKENDSLEIIEVKSKSWDPNEDVLVTKKGISSKWERYVADLAFQTYVTKKCYPASKTSSFLMVADKSSKATVDGLHQKFFLKKVGRSTAVIIDPQLKPEDLGKPILSLQDANQAVEYFMNQLFEGKTFEEYVDHLAHLWTQNVFSPPQVHGRCKGCEFRVPKEDLNNKASGFNKCWSAATGKPESEFDQPLVFDIWNLHYTKRDKLVEESRYKMSDVTEDDLRPTKAKDDDDGLSSFGRQWLQVQIQYNKTSSPYFDADGLAKKASKWKYPLHFIDFETITAAIPFSKGMRPYETVAFQFSHHTVSKDGNIEHCTEYINKIPGHFPNFDFVRELKKALTKDSGTVFRYAAHENTVLKHIREQLEDSGETDKKELIEFIDEITKDGDRAMVDMLELVKKYYISKHMAGSNSIKAVLPAALKESIYLKNKYSKPIYGGNKGIKSFNFKSMTWFVPGSDGLPKDPYKLLGPIMNDVDVDAAEKIDRVFDMDEIHEGGAASIAYARMQFTPMQDSERQQIASALLRYCELDTLAMVMIYEYWNDLLGN